MSLGINLINKLIKISSSSLKNDFDTIINESIIDIKLMHLQHCSNDGAGCSRRKNKKFENIKKSLVQT